MLWYSKTKPRLAVAGNPANGSSEKDFASSRGISCFTTNSDLPKNWAFWKKLNHVLGMLTFWVISYQIASGLCGRECADSDPLHLAQKDPKSYLPSNLWFAGLMFFLKERNAHQIMLHIIILSYHLSENVQHQFYQSPTPLLKKNETNKTCLRVNHPLISKLNGSHLQSSLLPQPPKNPLTRHLSFL